jgi:ATP-dependent Clp protease protease subunit
MLRAKALLDEVKESIINAYELKSGLARTKLSHLMDAETWMNANKAIELGFADKILFRAEEERSSLDTGQVLIFSRTAVTNSLLGKIPKQQKEKPKTGTPIESLYQRLSLISH